MRAINSFTDTAFPLTFSGGTLDMLGVEDDVRQSLFLLLSTEKGERLCRPDYGCALSRFAFENVTFSLVSSIKSEIIDAVKLYEKRAELLDVSVSEDDRSLQGGAGAESLIVKITYKIKDTAMEQTLDFPLADRLS